MKKYLQLSFLALLFAAQAFAQDFPVELPTQEQVSMKRYEKDTAAHAVFLNEYGTGKIGVNNSDNIRLTFAYHARVKIFDNRGMDNGTIEIPLRISGDLSDEVEDISGFTVYSDDNGLMQKINLDPSKVYTVKNNKYWRTLKFAMPGLRNGCIIEYSYKVVSPFLDSFHSWYFQAGIPKITSLFEAHIPAFWHYNALIRGPLKLTKNVAEAEADCFSTHGASSGCAHLVFGMNDIPAFIEEDYMTAPKNFSSAIYFELSDYTNPYDGARSKITKEWKDVDYQLKHEDYFGSQLKKINLLKTYVLPLIANKTNDLDKAKAVYQYIQKNMKWNNFYSMGSNDGIGKALENHTGTVGDINLLLVTALNAAGINTEAVLLSIRENGVVNKLYPTLEDFDYVIAKADIGDKSYFLDATDPLLGFGMLPIKCINGDGRVMSLDKPSYWLDVKPAQKRSNTYSLDLTLQPDGKIKGTLTHYSTGYAGYEKRKAIKKFNSLEEYVDALDDKLSKMKILKSDISNLDSLDMPVSEVYEIEFNTARDMSSSKIAFSPFVVAHIGTNPFKLIDRTYPVDWGMPSDDRFILNMHLPDNYTIETSPKPVSIAMPVQGGRLVTNLDPAENNFTFSNIIQFNKSIYTPEEYPYLKEFYNKIILSEKAEFVFKKK